MSGREGYGCDPILALAQRTLIVSVLYLLVEVVGIGVGLVPEAEAPDDLVHTLRAAFCVKQSGF
jgi:hypothetical protein